MLFPRLFDLADGGGGQATIGLLWRRDDREHEGSPVECKVSADQTRAIADDDGDFVHFGETETRLSLLNEILDQRHHRGDGVRVVWRWGGRDGDGQAILAREDRGGKVTRRVHSRENLFECRLFGRDLHR